MKLYSTQNRHGILNSSFSTYGQSEGACQIVAHENTLFCAFVNSTSATGPLAFMTRTNNANWGQPIAFAEDLHGAFAPCLFTFNGRLYALVGAVLGQSLLMVYNPVSQRFESAGLLSMAFSDTPSVAVLGGRAHLFFQTRGSSNLFHKTSSNLQQWSVATVLKSDGLHVISGAGRPVAITYQGLIHLCVRLDTGKFHLFKHDGSTAWTRGVQLIDAEFAYPPGMVVHNGLLKLAFSDAASASEHAIHLYCYDGNVIGPATLSTGLAATRGVGMGVVEGTLHAVYRGAP